MEKHQQVISIIEGVTVGGDKPLLLSGPCAAEGKGLCEEVAGKMKEIAGELGFNYVFKASFDKANRTSADSFRGKGMDEGMRILEHIKRTFDLPIVTDIHESYQASEVAEVADILQIPAFLCRQTDLLLAAAKTGKIVNIKKGQFMAPEDMQYAVNKVNAMADNPIALLTERGTTFGYGNLVVDMRSLPIMRQYAPVLFDVTHSVQRPGAAGGSSGGNREFAPYLAKAAAATGIDGYFIETHPNPEVAMSDGPNMIPLSGMKAFLMEILKIHSA
ncbi:MAG: 3-deoxy-8-phosphooctulonate synthase [Cyclobacteriaceae bacterium]|nr:3-deoxy-8-phosphooctulonate synthase [Cyclobacteriaceae bacterium]MCH8515120.1 3-deoxy-8-phosphooctulonate synthase [Cyclobacteriaceae bacterium]